MRKLYLNVGCGRDIRKSTKSIKWVNIDYKKHPGVDLVIDLDNDKLSNYFKPGTLDLIYCSHVIEHLVNAYAFIEDCKTILTKGGKIQAFMPTTKRCLVGHKNQGFGLDYFYEFGKTFSNIDLQKQDAFIVRSRYNMIMTNSNIRYWVVNRFKNFRDWICRQGCDEVEHVLIKK